MTDLLQPHRSHRFLAGVLAAMAVLGPFTAAVVAVDSGSPGDAEASVEVVVGFHGIAEPDLVRRYGGEVTDVLGAVGVVVADVPVSTLASLERHEAVAVVERDEPVDLELQSAGPEALDDADPDDRSASLQSADEGGNQTVPWGVSAVGADAVHAHGTTGDGVVVAVLDTGIDADHPDLEASYAGGVDVVDDDGVPEDDHGHGTHVAGSIAAADDDRGVVGVAPDVSIYGVKVLDESGTGSHSDVLAGIEWAIVGPDGVPGTEDDPDVISMSLGGFVGTESVHAALKRAYREHGILVVAGVGDAGRMDRYEDTVMAPARYDEVIAVGAVDRDDRVPEWSGFGPSLELVAPGVDVASTAHGGTLPGCGTSMATPHAAGVAALVYASDVPPEADADGDGSWDASEVRARLRATAVDVASVGRDPTSGFGRVWAPGAVDVSADNQRPSVTDVSVVADGDDPSAVTVRARVSDRETDVGDLEVVAVVDGREPVAGTFNETAGAFDVRLDASRLLQRDRHHVVVLARDGDGGLGSSVLVETFAPVADVSLVADSRAREHPAIRAR